MEDQKSQLQQITKLSDIIRAKYKKIKYNKITSEDKVNKVFKPVVEPLKQLVEISNDKTKQENEKVKQENNELKNQLIFKNYYDQDSNYSNNLFKDDDEKTVKGEETNENDLDDYKSVISNASTSKSNYQLAFDTSLNKTLESKVNNLLDKVEKNDREIDTEIGVRIAPSGFFMLGSKRIEFDDDKFTIDNKSYSLTDGLLELMFKKDPNVQTITSDDLEMMKELLLMTNVHRKSNSKNGELRYKNRKFEKHLTFLFNKYGQGLTDYMTYNNNKIDYVYWNDPNELCSRLKLLIASQAAGNTSHSNEINSIIEELREANVIY